MKPLDEHIEQSNILFNQVNTVCTGRPIPVVVEVCAQTIRACLRDVGIDERREYLRLINVALSQTLLDSEPVRGTLQ